MGFFQEKRGIVFARVAHQCSSGEIRKQPTQGCLRILTVSFAYLRANGA